MLGIFKDERRGLASFQNNPDGTGRFFPSAASRTTYVDTATLHRSLLTEGKTRLRQDGKLSLNRP